MSPQDPRKPARSLGLSEVAHCLDPARIWHGPGVEGPGGAYVIARSPRVAQWTLYRIDRARKTADPYGPPWPTLEAAHAAACLYALDPEA